ncbi:hypothetical protein GQ607_012232, partial [Colletotrichum asianum]
RPFTRQNRIGPQTPTCLTQTQTHGDAPKLHSSPPASSPPPTSASPLLWLSPTTLHLTLEPAHPQDSVANRAKRMQPLTRHPPKPSRFVRAVHPHPGGPWLTPEQKLWSREERSRQRHKKERQTLSTHKRHVAVGPSAPCLTHPPSPYLSLTHIIIHHPSSNHAASLDHEKLPVSPFSAEPGSSISPEPHATHQGPALLSHPSAVCLYVVAPS